MTDDRAQPGRVINRHVPVKAVSGDDRFSLGLLGEEMLSARDDLNVGPS